MRKDFYYPSSDGQTQIHAVEWIPDGDFGSIPVHKPNRIKAILQISHGMVEYILRYDQFAAYLNRYGIYVVGNDHLGHGQSVVSKEDYGFFRQPDGNECVVEDIHKLRCITQEKYPHIPYFVLGHSMGSFLVRQYLMLHGEGLSGAIIMGSGSQPGPVLTFGRVLCRALARVYGWHYRSRLANYLAFASNNKHFEPARTRLDWLTRDEAIVDAYRQDPYCSFVFTLNGFHEMFRGMQFIQSRKHIDRIPKDCPILIVSGKEDPIGDFGRGVRKVYHAYRKAGIKEVHIKLYPDDRHELLNELNREQVYRELKIWIRKHIPA